MVEEVYLVVISLCLQLKQQAAESEATRRGLERARQEVVRQVTAIAAEKDSLEKEASALNQSVSAMFILYKRETHKPIRINLRASILNQYGLDVWILFPLGVGIFVFTATFKVAVGPTQLLFTGH